MPLLANFTTSCSISAGPRRRFTTTFGFSFIPQLQHRFPSLQRWIARTLTIGLAFGERQRFRDRGRAIGGLLGNHGESDGKDVLAGFLAQLEIRAGAGGLVASKINPV